MIAGRLSIEMGVGMGKALAIALNRDLKNNAICAVDDMEMYSDSVEERATDFCRNERQAMGPEARKNT